MEQIRLCPCGERLIRKPGESAAQFRQRKFCNPQCCGKYKVRAPARRGFGFEVPTNKGQSVTTGFRSYLESRGGSSGETSEG